MLMRLALLGAAGYAGYRYLNRDGGGRSSPAAYGRDETPRGVRNAGPDAARDANSDNWTELDEELDQSFPASDPPANY